MTTNRCMNCMRKIEAYPCPHCGYDGSRREQGEWEKNALEPGTIIGGRYLLGCVREWGGPHITYIGLDLMKEQRVMVKEVFPFDGRREGTTDVQWQSAADREELQSILPEVLKLVQLEALPGIVDTYDMVEQNNTLYIIMEYVEGESLANRIRRTGPMAWSEVMRLFLPIIHSLEQVDALGIEHVGFEPYDLMITTDGTMKLLEFGAIQEFEDFDRAEDDGWLLHDFWFPVERFGKKEYLGPWTDVYFTAAIMLYAATGKRLEDARDRLVGDTLDLDAPEYQAIPTGARQALRHALAVLPKQRTQSMAAFAGELGEKDKKPLPKWLIPSVAAAAAALLVVTIGRAWYNGREKKSEEPTEESISAAYQATGNSVKRTIPSIDELVHGTEAQAEETLEEKVIPSSAGIEYEFYEDHVAVSGYTGSPEEVVIPSEVDGLPVTTIGKLAFYDCTSLTSITLPDGIATISNAAFSNCESLTDIVLPQSVTTIEEGAFRNCKKLTDIQLPEDLETIGAQAFTGAALTSVTITDGETIGHLAFYKCTKLNSVIITGEVENIEVSAFSTCETLASITITGNVETIEEYAFFNCEALTTIQITGGVDQIEKYAFFSCDSLKSVELPEETEIADGAFPDDTTIKRISSTGTSAEEETDRTTEFSIGKVSGRTYSNDYLGIRCTLSSEWEFATTAELAETNGIEESQQSDDYLAEACLENTYTLMTAYAMKSGAGHMVGIACLRMPEDYDRITNSVLKQVLEGRVESVIKNLEEMSVTDIDYELTTEEFLGQEQPALWVRGNIQGMSVSRMMILKVVGECVLEVNIISMGEDLPSEIWEECITAY